MDRLLSVSNRNRTINFKVKKKEAVYMCYKILKNLGYKKDSFDFVMYELEELGLIAVDDICSDDRYLKAWLCDESENFLGGIDNYMFVSGVFEPVDYDKETGAPCDWALTGFEIDPHDIATVMAVISNEL